MLELKHVPGRKTDVKDSEWLAQLLECGLLRASFVPPPPIRELRDITRYQVQQVRDRSREVNRLCKVLEDAGIKLTSVATDVLGVSGRAMVEALVAGTTDPMVLAELARGKLRKKLPELRRALQGRFRRHHAFLVDRSWPRSIFSTRRSSASPPSSIERLAPFAPMLAHLDTIPGVNRTTAVSILAETGGDMTRFPTAAHLCSWGGMCPGHDESAGKRRSGKTRKANRYLRAALIQAPRGEPREGHGVAGAVPPRQTPSRAQEGGRRGRPSDSRNRFHIMRDGVTYDELGADYFDRRHRDRTVRRHVRQLEALGFRVTIEEAA